MDETKLVTIQDGITHMDVAAFLRAYQMRVGNIMWFLGAGASRAAGIKTAGDMIWDFKQNLYRSHKKLPPNAITDPGDPVVQRKLQRYFDELQDFPASGAADEYARFFEATYPNAKDRQAYLERLIKLGKPTYGHLALALLMREGCCRLVWTTNFDRTVEDAAARIYGSTNDLVVADLGEPRKAADAFDARRFPIYGKLHGDYHSASLKNTDGELRHQDAEMRRAFVQACGSNGLAVVGYSGRDASVVEALREALNEGRGFPNGLFWFKRSGEAPFEAVTELIAEARRLGVDAHLIDNETFDELLSDLVRFLPETSDKLRDIDGAKPPRLGSAALKPPGAIVPSIRTNALPVISHPVMCQLIDCEIGGWSEIQDAIEKAGVDIVARRTRDGVIAFGRDPHVRATFDPFGIKRFETRSIPDKSLAYESEERRLIRDALMRALSNRAGIHLLRRGWRVFALPDPKTVTPAHFQRGSIRPIDSLTGVIGNTGIRWTECCELRLDYKLDRLWLLLDPRIHRNIPERATAEEIDESKEFVRSRLAGRFNPKANAMLSGWTSLLLGTDRTVTLRSFGISDGIDATFEMSTVTGFSGASR
ncbi:SIR2 family protein [Thalassobaculum litoreum]|uniref:SIR2-like domain-containing protein n=1 Tax=Thalassobaculum litoreum DSM 18839 TaxID=1123362 RepID=A0A8G2BNC5_9PROT|nr:SIR2 family protein [Thalassobaculum litoreum]SDG29075.1 SIR2-like domain-containing protein [Thalassobaculum litoreum DSM 18839]